MHLVTHASIHKTHDEGWKFPEPTPPCKVFYFYAQRESTWKFLIMNSTWIPLALTKPATQPQALEWCKHHKDYGGWVGERSSQASYPHTQYVYGEVHKLELKERKTWNLIRRLFAASLYRHASTLALSSRILILSMTRTFGVHTYLLLRVRLILAHTHEQGFTEMNSHSSKPLPLTRLFPIYIHIHVRTYVELSRILWNQLIF